MTALFLDPWSLTLPLDALGVDNYIANLVALSDGSLSTALPIEISARASELLEIDARFPLSAELPAFIWPNRNDVYRLVSGLLDRLPKIEDRGMAAILIENPQADPPFVDFYSTLHREHLEELSALALIVREASSCAAPTVCSTSVIDGSYRYQCDVLEIDSTIVPKPRVGTYLGEVPSCRSLQDFCTRVDVGILALSGDVLDAISIALWQSTGGELLPLQPRGWSVGKDFLSSVTACGLFNNEARMRAMLRTIVRIATGADYRTTHWLRVTRGGNADQRRRVSDGAGAWRADIDHELHFHYWVTPSGIECANIVQHNNFDISE